MMLCVGYCKRRRILVKKHMVRVVLVLTIAIATLLFGTTVYGYMKKMEIVEKALIMDLPENGTFLDYMYFAGHFRATISYDEQEYTYFENAFCDGASYLEYSVYDTAIEKNPFVYTQELIETKQYYAKLGRQNVSAIICRLDGKMILCVSSPIPKEERYRLYNDDYMLPRDKGTVRNY